MTAAEGVDCNNKGFICFDETKFYQCVEAGDKTVTLGEPQECPIGLYCNDNVDLECEEQWIIETTLQALSSTTVVHNATFEENTSTPKAHTTPSTEKGPTRPLTTSETDFYATTIVESHDSNSSTLRTPDYSAVTNSPNTSVTHKTVTVISSTTSISDHTRIEQETTSVLLSTVDVVDASSESDYRTTENTITSMQSNLSTLSDEAPQDDEVTRPTTTGTVQSGTEASKGENVTTLGPATSRDATNHVDSNRTTTSRTTWSEVSTELPSSATEGDTSDETVAATVFDTTKLNSATEVATSNTFSAITAPVPLTTSAASAATGTVSSPAEHTGGGSVLDEEVTIPVTAEGGTTTPRPTSFSDITLETHTTAGLANEIETTTTETSSSSSGSDGETTITEVPAVDTSTPSADNATGSHETTLTELTPTDAQTFLSSTTTEVEKYSGTTDPDLNTFEPGINSDSTTQKTELTNQPQLTSYTGSPDVDISNPPTTETVNKSAVVTTSTVPSESVSLQTTTVIDAATTNSVLPSYESNTTHVVLQDTMSTPGTVTVTHPEIETTSFWSSDIEDHTKPPSETNEGPEAGYTKSTTINTPSSSTFLIEVTDLTTLIPTLFPQVSSDRPLTTAVSHTSSTTTHVDQEESITTLKTLSTTDFSIETASSAVEEGNGTIASSEVTISTPSSDPVSSQFSTYKSIGEDTTGSPLLNTDLTTLVFTLLSNVSVSTAQSSSNTTDSDNDESTSPESIASSESSSTTYLASEESVVTVKAVSTTDFQIDIASSSSSAAEDTNGSSSAGVTDGSPVFSSTSPIENINVTTSVSTFRPSVPVSTARPLTTVSLTTVPYGSSTATYFPQDQSATTLKAVTATAKDETIFSSEATDASAAEVTTVTFRSDATVSSQATDAYVGLNNASVAVSFTTISDTFEDKGSSFVTIVSSESGTTTYSASQESITATKEGITNDFKIETTVSAEEEDATVSAAQTAESNAAAVTTPTVSGESVSSQNTIDEDVSADTAGSPSVFLSTFAPIENIDLTTSAATFRPSVQVSTARPLTTICDTPLTTLTIVSCGSSPASDFATDENVTTPRAACTIEDETAPSSKENQSNMEEDETIPSSEVTEANAAELSTSTFSSVSSQATTDEEISLFTTTLAVSFTTTSDTQRDNITTVEEGSLASAEPLPSRTTTDEDVAINTTGSSVQSSEYAVFTSTAANFDLSTSVSALPSSLPVSTGESLTTVLNPADETPISHEISAPTSVAPEASATTLEAVGTTDLEVDSPSSTSLEEGDGTTEIVTSTVSREIPLSHITTVAADITDSPLTQSQSVISTTSTETTAQPSASSPSTTVRFDSTTTPDGSGTTPSWSSNTESENENPLSTGAAEISTPEISRSTSSTERWSSEYTTVADAAVESTDNPVTPPQHNVSQSESTPEPSYGTSTSSVASGETTISNISLSSSSPASPSVPAEDDVSSTTSQSSIIDSSTVSEVTQRTNSTSTSAPGIGNYTPPCSGPVLPDEFVCTAAGKFPDVKKCNLFHICINAFVRYIDVPIYCPGRSSYDPYMRRCTNQPVQCPGERPLYCETPGIFPHPDYCSRYFKCKWRALYRSFDLIQLRCPPGFAYSPARRVCVRSLGCASSSSTDEAFVCTEPGRFPVESACNDYYECRPDGGETSYKLDLKRCPLNKLFDRELGRCREHYLVDCPFDSSDSLEDSRDYF